MKRIAVAMLLAVAAACSNGDKAGLPPASNGGSPDSNGSSVSSEAPAAAESNPPGDIPDNQTFVPFHTAGGFTIKVPEGWSRRDGSTSVTFTDKLNAITAAWKATSSPPTEQSARQNDVPQVQKTEHAFELRGIGTDPLPAGNAVLITYRSNSVPNDVTGRRYRLDVLRFELYRNGTEAILTLSSPVGADNVDPWRVVSRSFSWT